MGLHSWNNLQRLPFVFGFVFATAIFVPFIIAILSGNVTIYVPYISEGGGNFPEAGIFSTFLVLSAFTCQAIMLLRYLVVEDLSSKNDKSQVHAFLNKISLFLGTLSMVSLTVVAAYPTTSISQVHNTAVGMGCICIDLYMFCHTWCSLQTPGHPRTAKIRLVILIFSTISFLLVAVFGVLGAMNWFADHWSGSKIPGDQGFVYYVTSATFEWILAVLIFLYFLTFGQEFSHSVFHFRMETTFASVPSSVIVNR